MYSSKKFGQELKNTLITRGFKLYSFIKYINKIENYNYDELKKSKKIALDINSLCERIALGQISSWETEIFMNILEANLEKISLDDEIDEDSLNIQYEDLVFICDIRYKKIIMEKLEYCIEDLEIQDEINNEKKFLEVITYSEKNFKELKQEYEKHKFISLSNLDTHIKRNNLQLNTKIAIDISSWCFLVKDNENLLYSFENILFEVRNNNFFVDEKDILFVCNSKYKNTLLEQFKYCFDKVTEYKNNENTDNYETGVKRIIDIRDDELKSFFEKFEQELYGHDAFKEDFKNSIEEYRMFNKIGETKILSFFLMGHSGIGKTEVSNIIYNNLKTNNNSNLVKINLGNYSSQDALNSLIGSPRGFIGSENGELFIKLDKTDVGIILIDEIEKADKKIFNYFLEVLETGKATNSQGKEYDLDGYIIIFTSNVKKEKFTSVFSPELRSRFDLVYYFELLTREDKIKYLNDRLKKIIKKYNDEYNKKILKEDIEEIIKKIDVDNYLNIRYLNRAIKDEILKFLKNRERSDHK